MTPTDIDLARDFSGGDHLLDLLATGLAQAEPVPQTAMEQAYAACLMAKVDAELVALVADSSRSDTSRAVDGQGPVREAGPEASRELDIEGREGGSTAMLVDRFARSEPLLAAPSFRTPDASSGIIQRIATVAALAVDACRLWASKRRRPVTPETLARMELSTSADQLHPVGIQLVLLR
ncbi:MAG: hypothetical protein ACRBK7_01525 [Acidimicrobiales bacterium]